MDTTDPDRSRGDISIHDTMRVVDGVVRPRGSGRPNAASLVPPSTLVPDPVAEPETPSEAPAPDAPGG